MIKLRPTKAQKKAFVLRLFHRYTYLEIGEILECSPTVAKRRVEAAYLKFNKTIEILDKILPKLEELKKIIKL